jgi:hypothetical protein
VINQITNYKETKGIGNECRFKKAHGSYLLLSYQLRR